MMIAAAIRLARTIRAELAIGSDSPDGGIVLIGSAGGKGDRGAGLGSSRRGATCGLASGWLTTGEFLSESEMRGTVGS